MIHLNNNIRKKLVERKLRQESILIKESIASSRIKTILESVSMYSDVTEIPIDKRRKITAKLYMEFHLLHKRNILEENTGLWAALEGIFGNVGFGVIEGLIVEPFVNTILSKLGLGGFFKKFLVSFLSTNPGRVIEAFKDCKSMTKLISEALAEATFMMIQESVGAGGVGYDIIRNVLGKTVKQAGFVQDLEENLADTVCQGFNKLVSNAEGVKDKLGELKTKATEKLGLNQSQVMQPT